MTRLIKTYLLKIAYQMCLFLGMSDFKMTSLKSSSRKSHMEKISEQCDQNELQCADTNDLSTTSKLVGILTSTFHTVLILWLLRLYFYSAAQDAQPMLFKLSQATWTIWVAIEKYSLNHHSEPNPWIFL